MLIKIVTEYLGSDFCGWQKQIGVKTVQEVLESAISTFLISEIKKSNRVSEIYPNIEPGFVPNLQGSGRTDSGVHARGQVAHFNWPEMIEFDQLSFLKSINGIVPDGIAVISAEVVSDDFHSRKSAKSKLYSYRLVHRIAPPVLDLEQSWHLRQIDLLEEMFEAASVFLGVHDFSKFRAADCNAVNPVREIFLSNFSFEKNNILKYEVCGSGFLKHQVRFMVGSLVAVGMGKITKNQIVDMLGGMDRPNYELAPAKGLCLEKVNYL